MMAKIDKFQQRKRPGRVLLMGETLEPAGAERQLVTDATILSRAGWNVALASWAGGALESHLPQEVQVCRLRSSSWAGRLRSLLSYCMEFRPEVIQSHLTGANMLAAIVGYLLSIPVVVTEHGLGLWRMNKLRYRVAVKITYLCAKEIQCVCNTTRHIKMSNEHAPLAKTTVVHNCFSRDSVADGPSGSLLRKDLKIPTDAVVIVFVGRLIDVKRPDLLMVLAQRLLTADESTYLIIAGDGPWQIRIRNWSFKSGIRERVKLIGVSSNMRAVYGAADILISTSVREALSLTLIEAAASKVPSIAFDVGGNAEVIAANQTGFLIPFGDTESFSTQLINLVGNVNLRHSIGHAARERAESLFSPEVRLNSLETCYYRLASIKS
mgnify:CR=1 FL=1